MNWKPADVVPRHGHWEFWGVSLALQSAIEEFAHKPGADGRSRGGDKEA